MKRRYLLYGLGLLVLVIAGFSMLLLAQQPSDDRDWAEDQSRVARAEAAGTSTVFYDVRDWTYDANGPVEKSWRTVEVDPEAIERVWFLIDYFSPIQGIAHAFLSFEFADGTTLVLSVEARRESDEAYSPVSGAFRAYELSYVWATERDMVTRRLVAAGNPVSMYPLEFADEEARELFRALVEETNDLASEPRFYNTVTGNCMNLLAVLINGSSPGRLPYDIAWNLPGYADTYLMKQGLIAADEPYEAARERYDLAPLRAQIADSASLPPEAFSAALRALLDA